MKSLTTEHKLALMLKKKGDLCVMDMEIYSIINTITTLFLGGGWFLHWRASRRKANGEATQSEADGWLKQQEVYQNTIEHQKMYCDRMKEDFNIVVEENTQLRKENNELRAKVNSLENLVYDLKKEVSRLGRRVEALSEKRSRKSGKSEQQQEEEN